MHTGEERPKVAVLGGSLGTPITEALIRSVREDYEVTCIDIHDDKFFEGIADGRLSGMHKRDKAFRDLTELLKEVDVCKTMLDARNEIIAEELPRQQGKTHKYNQYEKVNKNRNKPCPCGSGNKFKKCCWALGWRRVEYGTTINSRAEDSQSQSTP